MAVGCRQRVKAEKKKLDTLSGRKLLNAVWKTLSKAHMPGKIRKEARRAIAQLAEPARNKAMRLLRRADVYIYPLVVEHAVSEVKGRR